MNALWHEVWRGVQSDFADLPGVAEVTQIVLRLLLAALLGGLLGFQRERVGKAAGLRTHMLVALGSAFFVMIPYQAGMPLADLSRVLQGVITGMGFLGAGTILKRPEEEHIEGLTTAAGIWLTAYFVNYGIASWLPTLYTKTFHVDVDTALHYSILTSVAASALATS